METFKLARDIPVLDGYDVLVAGGGPAGSAAAVSAARLGARVLLVEASGCLGGMGTAGLVANFAPMSDGCRTSRTQPVSAPIRSFPAAAAMTR